MIDGLDGLINKLDREIIEGLTDLERDQIFNYLINLRDYQKIGSMYKFRDNEEKIRIYEERIRILTDYIMNKMHSCPFDDKSGIDFKKECVVFGEAGCGECLLRYLNKLTGA